MKSISMIDITKIKDDTSIQCRVSIDEQNIADIMTALDDTPPIRLFREVQGGEVVYHIGDGWHRKIAHERAGRLLICAIVEEGGLEAALLYAVQANGPKEHGVKRTNADKLKAIAVYLTFKDWYLHSDPMVAKACAVSHHTVEKQRAALELAGTIPVARERLGLDGKIQASQKQVGKCQPESNPPRPPDHDASAEMYPREAPPTRLSISAFHERTGPDLFDQAEARPRVRPTLCTYDGPIPCARVAYNGGVLCTEHLKEAQEKKEIHEPTTARAEVFTPGVPESGIGSHPSRSEGPVSNMLPPLDPVASHNAGSLDTGDRQGEGGATSESLKTTEADSEQACEVAGAGEGKATQREADRCPHHQLPREECLLMACPWAKETHEAANPTQEVCTDRLRREDRAGLPVADMGRHMDTSLPALLGEDPNPGTGPVVEGQEGTATEGSAAEHTAVVGGATQSEVAASVDAYFAKHPPDPKALLPTQTNGKPDYQHGNTPAWLRDLIREISPIALDPCHNEHSILGAKVTLDRDANGISSSHSWLGLSITEGLIYVNPPYEDISPWALRSIAEAQDGAEIVLCLPSSHSTGWYKLLRGKCQLLIQLGKKVAFGLGGVFGSTAFHETSLFYFGPQAAKVQAIMEREGHDVTSRKEYVAPAPTPTPPKEESNTEKLSLPMDRMIAIEQGFLEIRKTNYIREAEEIRDRLLKEAESPGEKTEIQTRWEVWYATRPPAKPYNHKVKEAPITSPLKKGRSR